MPTAEALSHLLDVVGADGGLRKLAQQRNKRSHGALELVRLAEISSLQDLFDLSRNHYDRLGHFAQGFIPALLAREILKRCSPLGQSRWLPFLVVCVCLAFSAFYELIEWWVSLALGQAAGEFLGTQGDVWDTQWDMFLALVGACVSLIALGRAHDRSLAKLGVYPPRDPG